MKILDKKLSETTIGELISLIEETIEQKLVELTLDESNMIVNDDVIEKLNRSTEDIRSKRNIYSEEEVLERLNL